MNNDFAVIMKRRTFKLTLEVLDILSNTKLITYTDQTITRQLIRSICSVSANYRSAARSKSKRDFINKLKIVEEEADESIYWMDLIESTQLSSDLSSCKKETEEILKIIVSSLKTARKST